jgi:hypothetical protein
MTDYILAIEAEAATLAKDPELGQVRVPVVRDVPRREPASPQLGQGVVTDLTEFPADGIRKEPVGSDESLVGELDVERLATAMHERLLHNERGGMDDDLAKRACVQFGWDKSRCLQRARSLAAEYAALSERRYGETPE